MTISIIIIIESFSIGKYYYILPFYVYRKFNTYFIVDDLNSSRL